MTRCWIGSGVMCGGGSRAEQRGHQGSQWHGRHGSHCTIQLPDTLQMKLTSYTTLQIIRNWTIWSKVNRSDEAVVSGQVFRLVTQRFSSEWLFWWMRIWVVPFNWVQASLFIFIYSNQCKCWPSIAQLRKKVRKMNPSCNISCTGN